MFQDLRAFSSALRAHRTRAGLTQRQLADSAGVSIRTVRAIEGGHVQRPRIASLRLLASVVGLDDKPETPVSAAFRIEVLGSLSVRDGDTPLHAGPVKQRSLLALLALHANHVVPQSEIVDVLWGDRPPATCRELLYASVSRLRKVLRHGSGRIDVTSGASYRLRIAATELDLLRFDELAARGAWAEALDCWRGSILADLPDPVRRHPAAVALAQRRLAATFAHADASFAQGRHAQAVPALRALLADEPLHEELHARLMLALAGCGQQGAALELYTSLKEKLADDLGVEPGAGLQEAHLRVVRQEVTADRPAPVPRQLPAAPSRFSGRVRELAALDDGCAFGGAVVISAIGGAGGIGKTWLAVTWAHRNAARFPDGQLYVNLRGYDPTAAPLSAEAALRGFLRALGVESIPPDLDAQSALYRSLVADKTMLVLLDNARDTAQVTPLLPGSPTTTVLITSRSTLPGLVATQGAQALSLESLSDVDARALLAARLGPARTAAEPGAVDEILRSCAGLPLALGIVAARATAVRLGDLAAELSAVGTRLSALDTGELLVNLRAVFDASHAALSPGAALLFRQLAIAPGPDISLGAVVAIAGAATRLSLSELVTAHLVEEHVPGRYRMHDLVRLYATERCADAERESALRRVVAHYLHSAIACRDMMCPHLPRLDVGPPERGCVPYRPADVAGAMTWTEAEHAALLGVTALRLPAATWQLAKALDVYHWRTGQSRDAIAMWTEGRSVAEQEGKLAVVARADTNLGDSYATLGDFDLALLHLERAVALSASLGDRIEEAHAHNSLAWAWEGREDYATALSHAHRALDLYRELGEPQLEADMLNCVGWCLIRSGEHESGRSWCQRALALCGRHDHVDGAAHALRSLGELALETGEHAEAARRFRAAHDHFQALHHPFAAAGVLARLGEAEHALGHAGLAREAWLRALALYQAQHRTAAVRRVREQLARLSS